MEPKRLSGSLTIRVPQRSLRVLRQRAKEEGKTPSEFVRGLLERELQSPVAETGPTLMERTVRWVGVLDDPSVSAGRDARADSEGWMPDRRG